MLQTLHIGQQESHECKQINRKKKFAFKRECWAGASMCSSKLFPACIVPHQIAPGPGQTSRAFWSSIEMDKPFGSLLTDLPNYVNLLIDVCQILLSPPPHHHPTTHPPTHPPNQTPTSGQLGSCARGHCGDELWAHLKFIN